MNHSLRTSLADRVARIEALLAEAHALTADMAALCVGATARPTPLPPPARPSQPSKRRRRREAVPNDPDRDLRIRVALWTGPLATPTRVPLRLLIERCADIPGATPAAVQHVLDGLKDTGIIGGAHGQYWRAA